MSALGSTKWCSKTFQDYSGLKSEVFENSDSENIVSFYLCLELLNFIIQVLPAALWGPESPF